MYILEAFVWEHFIGIQVTKVAYILHTERKKNTLVIGVQGISPEKKKNTCT